MLFPAQLHSTMQFAFLLMIRSFLIGWVMLASLEETFSNWLTILLWYIASHMQRSLQGKNIHSYLDSMQSHYQNQLSYHPRCMFIHHMIAIARNLSPTLCSVQAFRATPLQRNKFQVNLLDWQSRCAVLLLFQIQSQHIIHIHASNWQ